MVDWYLVSVLIFAAFLAVLVYLDRKSWKRESILLLRKTQKGKAFLIWLGTRFPRFWKVFGTIGVVITFLASVWIIWVIASLMVYNMFAAQAIPGLSLVLPFPSTETVVGPGGLAVGVPFWYWIISIAVLVIVHEGMHGVMAAREKTRVKSLGVGLLAIIPLAFVEPDEKQLQKKKSLQQLRVFAVGSFANFITAAIVLLILTVSFFAVFAPKGAIYTGITEGSPAAAINMSYPGIILSINNQTVAGRDGLSQLLTEIGPNKQIQIDTLILEKNGTTKEMVYTLTTGKALNQSGSPTGKGLIGIQGIFDGNDVVGTFTAAPLFISNNVFISLFSMKPAFVPYSGILLFVFGLLAFLYVINLGVGLVNMLPIGPLDGGRMWGIVFDKIFGKRGKKIMSIVTYLILLMILITFFTPILRTYL